MRNRKGVKHNKGGTDRQTQIANTETYNTTRAELSNKHTMQTKKHEKIKRRNPGTHKIGALVSKFVCYESA